MKIIPNGEGRAKFIRNKRGGVRLKVVVDPIVAGVLCNHCFVRTLNIDLPPYCLELCKEFEQETGERSYWFEKDVVESNKREV